MNVNLNLECGTSLAEFEYTSEQQDEERKRHYKSNKNENSGKALTESTVSWPRSIRGMRSSLAKDIVGNNNYDSLDNTHGTISTFESPFLGRNERYSNVNVRVPLIYCDQTASNRPLSSIEAYIEGRCLPLYGNTHTNTSITGSQSTAFVAEARQIVAEGVNAKITGKASLDVVLFAGNGATSAVQLLIDCIGVHNYNYNHNNRPVVFVGPYEHHSNLLPWRESGCEIVMVPEHKHNHDVDFDELKRLLQLPQYGHNTNRLRMGAFTAASNVTGKVCDVNRIAATLHAYSALAFFDYATGAPYLPIDMNPTSDKGTENTAKDAIYLSPHKMIGGTNTPGILVIKKRLVHQSNPPSKSGGGTVFYVTHTHHRFLSNRIERYEGGTPNVVGIWRAGLVFLLKRLVNNRYRRILSYYNHETIPNTIVQYEFQTHRRIVHRLQQTAPNLILLGRTNIPDNDTVAHHQNHLPIFSFLIKCGKRFLHYNYVCAILNDLFGIQSRGGCQCSGPYSQRLLGLTTTIASLENGDNATLSSTTTTTTTTTAAAADTTKSLRMEVPNQINHKIEHALLHHKERAELLRPGYTRLSLPFKGIREEEEEYVLNALEWLAKHGWAMMCQYSCNHRTGEWRHFSRQGKPLGRTERRWLSHYDMDFMDGKVLTGNGQGNGNHDNHNHNHNNNNNNDEDANVKQVLEEALTNANAQLEIAKTDQRYISQALKMTDENGILGKQGDDGDDDDDDELDDLRWYVYPKEVAKWLNRGEVVTIPPETESKEVLGAICPLGFGLVHSSPAMKKARDVGATLFSDRHDGHWTKITTLPSTSTAIVHDTTSSTTTNVENAQTCPIEFDVQIRPIVNDNGRFHFRDGEDHSGEASLDDIESGYNDGELSDMAQVFNPQTDEWVDVEIFLKSRKKARNGNDGDRDAQQHKTLHVDTLKDMNSDAFVPQSGETKKQDGFTTESEEKKEDPSKNKKAVRGPSTWGKSISSSHVHLTASLQEANDSKLTEKSDVGTVENSASSPIATHSSDAISPPMSNKQRKAVGKIKPPAKMMRYITQAMIQWDMVKDGDRLLLGLSGGKDSLSLLHCLLEFQRKLPIQFDIEVCTIDPMTPSFDPSPLIPYVKSLGLKYHYIRDDIVDRANKSGKDGKVVSSLCAFCARMKRGNLYSCARKNNCNKLVLAQHLDDCAESFLMSVMHNGFLRTMKAHYQINAGDMSVIRPMVYCRESLMTEFAKTANLPVINENCPACFEEPKERARIKKLLSREETLYPNLYDNVRRSLIPLLHDDSTAILRCYMEEALAKSRKNQTNNGKKGKKRGNYNRNNKKQTDMETEKTGNKVKPDSIFKPIQETSNEEGRKKALIDATEEELVRELARRKAERYQLAGAMKRLVADDETDPTGQVCTIDGRNGTIPCRELME